MVSTMSTKHWYRFLMEIEFSAFDETLAISQLKPCKAELSKSDIDWPQVWSNARHPSFDSEMSSLSFMILHDLLPVEERLSRILKNQSPFCKYSCSGSPISDQFHVSFNCKESKEVGDWLLRCVRLLYPDISPETLLGLNLVGFDAILWLTVATFNYIWKRRKKGKRCFIQECKDVLISNIDALAKTKYYEIAMTISAIISM